MDSGKKALNWDDNPERVRRTQIIAQQIEKFLPDKYGLTALEIGSGKGMLSFLLKDKFEKITLLDISEEMIDTIKQRMADEGISHFYPKVADILGDESNIPAADVMYLSVVLHHIEDLKHAFDVFRKHLLPGGLLFIADLVTEDGSFHRTFSGFYTRVFRAKNYISWSQVPVWKQWVTALL